MLNIRLLCVNESFVFLTPFCSTSLPYVHQNSANHVVCVLHRPVFLSSKDEVDTVVENNDKKSMYSVYQQLMRQKQHKIYQTQVIVALQCKSFSVSRNIVKRDINRCIYCFTLKVYGTNGPQAWMVKFKTTCVRYFRIITSVFSTELQ